MEKLEEAKSPKFEREPSFRFMPFIVLGFSFFFLLSIILLISILIAIFVNLTSLWFLFIIPGMYLFLNLILTINILKLKNKAHKNSWREWLFTIYVLPIFGAIYYCIHGNIYLWNYRKNFTKRVRDREELLNSKSSNDNNKLSKIEQVSSLTNRKLFKNSEIELISANQKFKHLFVEIKKAKRYIYIQYYIFSLGEIYSDLLEIISQKIKEGVEVKILVDYYGGNVSHTSNLKNFKDAGAEIAYFNRINFYLNLGIHNLRNHRKIVIIDSNVAFIGGMNVGDEYVGYSDKIGVWVDAHSKISGDGIEDILKSFFLDWNCSSKSKIKDLDEKLNLIRPSKKGELCIVDDGFDLKNKDAIETIFLQILSNAKNRIWISSPYTIIHKDILDVLIKASMRGIDVRIYTPQKYHQRVLMLAGTMTLNSLKKYKGIKIYQTLNTFLHSKLILVDDDLAMIGTTNLDNRSFYINYEINAFFNSRKTIRDIEKEMLEYESHSKEYEYNKEIYRRGLLSKRVRIRFFSSLL